MTELLVVIGIIILVVGIAMPSLTRAWRTADRTRTAGDLQAIATALEAYKQDHGDYPRVRFDAGIPRNTADRPNPPTGAQILCQALVGPAPDAEGSTPPTNARAKQDGAAGPGFRTRGTTGRVYGPYLPPDRFKIANPDKASPFQQPPANALLVCILDRYDRPILYFPASPTKPNINVMNSGGRPSYVHTDAPGDNGPQSEVSLYDADDNLTYFQRSTGDANGIVRIRLMLGDLPLNQSGDPKDWSGAPNGVIGANETAAATGPFLLWSSGPDELFGPDAGTAPNTGVLNHLDAARCDDVTNFRS